MPMAQRAICCCRGASAIRMFCTVATLLQPVSLRQFGAVERVYQRFGVAGQGRMLLVAAAVLVVDSISKLAAEVLLRRWPDQSLDLIEGVVRLSPVGNNGDVLGGILQTLPAHEASGAFAALDNQLARDAGICVLAALLCFAYYRCIPPQNRFLMACLGLQLGGAAGNLLDRLQHRRITDFIGLGLGSVSQPWFLVFNLADLSLLLGIVLMAGYLALHPRALSQARRAGRYFRGSTERAF
jgi:signal peptidase II